jgi:predicted MFS family arabinose efflux permease
MGPPVGQLLGVAIGGIVADLWGWRSAFFVAGAPGIVLALLALTTLREPRRSKAAIARNKPPPFGAALRELTGKRTFWLLAFGAAAAAFTFYGHGAFTGSFFLRNHLAELAATGAALGLKPIGFLGVALGVSSGLAGIVGAIIGGRLADRWVARDLAGYALLPAICSALSVPFLIAAMLVEGLWLAIALIGVAAMLNAAWFGPVYAGILGLVHAQSRATASAIVLFVISLVGLGFGPLCVGLLSDVLTTWSDMSEAEGLRAAMVAATGASLLSGVLFWMARGSIRTETIG